MEAADGGDDGAEAVGDHLPGQGVRGLAPDGEGGGEAGAGEVGFAVSPYVFEEEVAEGEGGGAQAVGEGADAVEEGAHGGFVGLVGAGVGDGDFVEGEAEAIGLQLQDGAGGRLDGDAVVGGVDGGEDAADVPALRVGAEDMQGPGGVLARGP